MLKKVILFVILSCLETNLFAQQNNNPWKWWRKNTPATHFYVSIAVDNYFALAGGEGSNIYKIISEGPDKLFTNLNLGPDVDVVDMANDPKSNDIIVLAEDRFTGESYLLSVSSDGKVKDLMTTDKPLYSVNVDDNNTIDLTGNGEIITSADRMNFTDHKIPDFYSISDAIRYFQMKYILFGKSNAGNENGIRTTTDFMNFNTPMFNYSNPISFEKSSGFGGFIASGRIAKALQTVPIFATGYQAATNSYVVCRSTDDGATWDSVYASSQLYSLPGISAGSNSNVIIGGNGFSGGELYYTKDGGDTWSQGYDASGYIYSITYISADSAYALGEKGLILLTTDGGENWTQISESHPSVSAIYFPSHSVGYAAGISGPSPSHQLNIYKTTDAGEIWKVTYVDSSFAPSYADVSSIFFIDDVTGFLAGSKFIKTTDGGMTWNIVNSGIPSDPSFGDPYFQDVYFVNNDLGFAVYRNPSTGDGVIKTTDVGMTWDSLNFKNNKFDKKYIYFADENLGFVSGYSTLYRTTDGGDNWDTLDVASGTTRGYFEESNSKVNFINSSTGFFGKKGHIFKTTDRGDTWTDAPIDNHTMPTQIQFVSDSIGYAVCGTDTFGVPLNIFYKSTDGGKSWSDLTNELPTTGISSMFFTDENTGFLTGNHGILKTTSGGETITSIKEIDNASIPTGYRLYQNYPNPFNPTTKIRYSIPNVGTSLMKFVKLKVYDILGRKVTTLVNKQQPPGNYVVEFNASKFASGIYFYRIITNDFTATKKLVLLK